MSLTCTRKTVGRSLVFRFLIVFRQQDGDNGHNLKQLQALHDNLNPKSFMRSWKWNLFLLPALIAGLGLFLAPGAQAQFQWAKRIASTIDTDTELSIGMTLDTNGNCYVTGWFDGTNDFGGVTLTNDGGGGQDIFVAKYNSSGTLQWANRAGGSSANRDAGRGIGVDTDGNVYVAGGYYGPADFGSINLAASASQVFFLAKYDN